MRSSDMKRRIRHHIDNLGHEDERVARRSEQYLVDCYGAEAIHELIEACEDPNPNVRHRAVWVIGHTRDPAAYDSIMRLTRDADFNVMADAILGLGRLGDIRAMPWLIDCISGKDIDIPMACWYACHAIKLMGAPAIDYLVPLLYDADDDTIGRAVLLLGDIEHESVIRHLFDRLKCANAPLRVEILGSLSVSRYSRVIEIIDLYLDNEDEHVRECARASHDIFLEAHPA